MALLIASFVVKIWPNIPRASLDEGVPVKGYILQSVEFTVCAAVLFDLAMTKASLRQWKMSAVLAVLALAFLGNIFFVVTGRTALVIIPALALLYGYRHSGWKGFLGACALMVAVAAVGWTASPYLRERVSGTWSETERYEKNSEANSSGLRLDFWKKSIGFIESAPLLGHGTGSITDEFKRAARIRERQSALPLRQIRTIKPSPSAFSSGFWESRCCGRCGCPISCCSAGPGFGRGSASSS